MLNELDQKYLKLKADYKLLRVKMDKKSQEEAERVLREIQLISKNVSEDAIAAGTLI